MAPGFGITRELIALLKREEGWVPHPYVCPAGYPTIGYGHRIPSMRHENITLEQGLEILMDDIRFKRDAILKLSPILATEPEPRLAAVIEFCFNLGEGAYRTSTMKKYIDAGNWPAAAAQMRRWVFARNPKTKRMEKLPGLVRRRAVASKWLEEGR